MNRVILSELALLIGPTLIDKCYRLARSEPVSFARLRKCLSDRQMELEFEKKRSKHSIAAHFNCSTRTVERHQTQWLFKDKSKSVKTVPH